MLGKFLITILLIFEPLIFSVEPVQQPLPIEAPVEEEIGKQHLSSISSLWFSNPNFLPMRDWGIDDPEIAAEAALVSNLADEPSLLSKNKILYQKNIDDVFPIASLTKLMTAVVVLENINLSEEVIISENALSAYGDKGGLVIGEKITVENLLYALLVESSNDAAVALAEAVQVKTGNDFVWLMNEKAKSLNLGKTNFTDSSGYQADNISTVGDLSELVKYVFKYPLIWQITRTPAIDLSSIDGEIKHHWISTNELLGNLPNIIGGKTGYTQEAQGCFILITQQLEKDYLITIILGAEERFAEAKKLVEWAGEAYRWE